MGKGQVSSRHLGGGACYCDYESLCLWSGGISEHRPARTPAEPLPGLETLPPWEGAHNRSAPANPSLLAWQPEDKAGQKYLCGWRKVNFSASLFFPGNRGHCQIQQNRSRDGAGEAPTGSQRALPPPFTHSCCLLPSGSVTG